MIKKLGAADAYQSRIAKELNVSRQLLTPHIKWLLKRGYIKMYLVFGQKRIALADISESLPLIAQPEIKPLHYISGNSVASGFLNRRQEAELLTSLGTMGEIPLKFAYLAEGATNWDRVGSKGDISIIQRKLIISRITQFINVLPKDSRINVVDIGCGNGAPAIMIMEELKRKGFGFAYVPLDVSRAMLDLAGERVRSKIGGLKVNKIEFDFEHGNFSDRIYDLTGEGEINLLLFLGNTLGNQSDRNRVLTNFKESMSSKDFLIVANELTNVARTARIVAHYNNKDVSDLVYLTAARIGIGRADTVYDVSWNERLYQVEMCMVLKKNMEIKIGSGRVSLEKGERILLARSKKFTEWAFTKLLSKAGFRTVLFASNEDDSYVLSMLQPTRYTN
ncbi:MAG: L-histidine N(alpha)-methyltransferase [Candidatus Micrarchaeota archaeon]|nr:L-histidine N(alpha)-methyltransferase [Candidatus Micrarchaeota archaeon]